MYCFRCGTKLPPKVTNCPDCDALQKRRQRYRSRMMLGLFLFLSGAICGSIFDSIFFKGRIWEHSFLGALYNNETEQKNENEVASVTILFRENQNTDVATANISDTDPHDDLPPPSDLVNKTASISNNLANKPASALASETTNTKPVETLPNATSTIVATTTNPVSTPATTTTLVPDSTVIPVVEPTKNGDTTMSLLDLKPVKRVFSKVEILEKTSGNNYHGSISKNGKELVFASNRLKIDGQNVYQCFIKSPDEKAVSTKAFDWPGNVWTPELTPDSKKIVFSSDSQKPEHIFVYDRESKKSKVLTKGNTKNMMCALSPDGQLVAFTSGQQGSGNIWIVGIDGENLMQITSSKEDDREPRWFPDGKSLCFTRIFAYTKKSSIMKISLDPLSEPEIITTDNNRNWLPDISPDGQYLTYVRQEKMPDEKNVIVMRDIKAKNEQVLYPLGEKMDHYRPIWAQDASGFVFHAASGRGNRSLYFARFIPVK